MIRQVCNELLEKLVAIAPDYQQLLAPPATEEALCMLEETLKLTLPGDYREFLKLHNGCQGGNLLIAFSLFCVDEIATRTTAIREDLADSSREFDAGGWDSQKLLIGDSQFGWTLAIDCESGVPFVHAQSNYALPLAGSFSQYLVGLKNNLRDGRFQLIGGKVFMDEWGQSSQ